MKSPLEFSARWVMATDGTRCYEVNVTFMNEENKRTTHTVRNPSKRKAIKRMRKALRAFWVESPW